MSTPLSGFKRAFIWISTFDALKMKHYIAFILVLVQQSEARLDPYDGITFTDVILNRNFISCK